MSPEQLVQEYGSYVNRLVFRMIKERSLAEDISQEIWLEILRSFNSFKGDSKLSTWIYTIASRIILKRSKAERSISRAQFDEFFATPLELSIDPTVEKSLWVREKCDRCVTSFLHCIKHEERLALLLHDFLELDYKEVAEITGAKEATLRKQVSRGRQKICGCITSVCPLVGDRGTCRCHISREVNETALKESLLKFKSAYEKANELTLLDMTFPTKNYWEKFL